MGFVPNDGDSVPSREHVFGEDYINFQKENINEPNNFNGHEDIEIHTYNGTLVAPTLDNGRKRKLSIKKIGEVMDILHSLPVMEMSNYSRVQENLDCVADDLEREVEVDDSENDSPTIVTSGNKRKKSLSSKPPLPRKQMAPRSTVWQHFTRLPDNDKKCKCNYCGNEFECGSARRATVKMIVLDDVENSGFKHFCSVAAPKYLLPSRRTIARDTLDMYVEEKAKLKSLLVGNKQRVSLTTDIWTSITTRVCAVTVDNASPNEGALRYLIDSLKTWKDGVLALNGDYLHVRCCADILNLIVTEGLKELEPSIVSVRNAVKYVRSSTARMQAFQIRVQQEKINSRGSVILDFPTRWNSTYSMLSTTLKFKPTFDQMKFEDKLYDTYFNEKEGGKKKREGPPLYSDWENARCIVKFLKTFYDATLQFSSSLKVTSNTCYNLICQIKQSLESLSASNDSLLGLMAIKMKEKFDKYWDSAKCIEMKEMVKDLLTKLYESYNAQYKPGGSGSASESASGSQILAIRSGSGSNFWDLGGDDDVMIEDSFSEFSKAVAVSEGSPELSNELDLYLMEKTEKIAKGNLDTKFDILLWWRVNSANYPILSRIARDVLAIPMSIVASESTFNTEARDVLAIPVSTVASESAFRTFCGSNSRLK
ncbi:BED-type domain-containing protein [Citrus sinensis]|uniref:BED-type domain-containing protein n=1 Tax=Citrus sinensis TaxID=2711 RepID=A0ACB8L8L6_CITSI|nr:BED-type domain-containing protein [Citrus sinensis]